MANKSAKCSGGQWLKFYIKLVEMNFRKSFRQALRILFDYRSVVVKRNNLLHINKYLVSHLENYVERPPNTLVCYVPTKVLRNSLHRHFVALPCGEIPATLN